MKKKRHFGFTLVELLVVVSVIALLLGILIPSLSMARESGSMAVCGTQMNQIFQASFQHANDNEDRIPYFAWMSGRGSHAEWWPTEVAQAMNQFEEEIYTCPTDKNPHNVVTVYISGATISLVRPPSVTTGRGKNRTTRTSRNVRLPITYRGSCDMVEYIRGNAGALQPRKITSWQRPTEALMLIEGRSKIGDPNRECFRFAGDLGVLASGAKHPYQEDWERHLGQANYLFVDGHVDTLMPVDAGNLANNQEHYLP
tara:strand:+ start:3119 stop:3886 length:768 start_codon:yes stop_codon:yes gene_type:complete